MTTKTLGSIQVGDPVILTNAKDLGKYGFRKGMKGTCNALVNSDGRWLYFQPANQKEVYVIDAGRCILDEKAKAESVPIEEA